jgi:hypothetical protein
MASPVRTPYQVCADVGTRLDGALKAIGIHVDRSAVHVTEWADGMRPHRVVPPQLTPSQTAMLARNLKGEAR